MDEQLGEVQEEDEAGDRGREERVRQGERKESGSKIDRDQELLEDLMDKEEDLHQRSASDTNLR